ncbi:unnamed protein product [Somion occarium]
MRVGTGVRWMSAYTPPQGDTSTSPRPKKVTIGHLRQLWRTKTPITVLTAYDFPTGRLCEKAGVDITLVGDSLAQVCLGYESTTQLTMDEMIHHCRAVARGSKLPFLVADMPFGSYYSIDEAARNAFRLIREGGVDAVKIEGGKDIIKTVAKLTAIGIPVMGHIGLLPQRHTVFSGYRVQGRLANRAASIVADAFALQSAGVFAIVVEAVPAPLGAYITENLQHVPTIGIGAGKATSGQVLVINDALGVAEWAPKFVRKFGNIGEKAEEGAKAYIQAVRNREFPDNEESYFMAGNEWRKFIHELGGSSTKSTWVDVTSNGEDSSESTASLNDFSLPTLAGFMEEADIVEVDSQESKLEEPISEVSISEEPQPEIPKPEEPKPEEPKPDESKSAESKPVVPPSQQ